MIIGSISELKDYACVLPNLLKGLKACEKADELPAGRYGFEGGYFMIQQGQTKPLAEGTYEAHRDYIDVQILLEGAEEIAWEKLENLKECIPYDEKTDKARYNGDHSHHMLITEGMFWAAYPEDGHQALGHLEEPYNYKKIVLKLPVATTEE
ncbi:MAG: YhcH/YjgK/YiaL family protein [Erysipelotrichaceae bacterium]|nr:YhcH/YjgK/YiaL family protein [Erysipelotrichaceae bacterium]